MPADPESGQGPAAADPAQQQQQQQQQQHADGGPAADKPIKRYRRTELEEEEAKKKLLLLEEEGDEQYEEYVPRKKRREADEAVLMRLQGLAGPAAPEGDDDTGSEIDDEDEEQQQQQPASKAARPASAPQQRGKESLLVQTARAKKEAPLESATDKVLAEEADMMRHITQKQALRAAKELATDTVYTRSMSTGWKPPAEARGWSARKAQALREQFHISVAGDNVPPPLPSFALMKLPPPIASLLQQKGIKRPTPIQIQGIPAALAGRDIIGISFTGSGKTLVYSLPLICIAVQDEMMMPLEGGEGPLGLIVCPSRELANQTVEVITQYTDALKAGGFPELRVMLCIGGIDMRAQMDMLKRGVHIVVATPGRLKDLLTKRRMNLDICRYLALDEADRMVDLGFEEEMREILSFFKSQRQTLMFSATMPAKIKTFAESALVDPIEVNVGRAGAANLDVIQEVEYVKEEDKLAYLLDCLQKTAPPVLVFAENKRDVDAIHEALLLQGVDVVAVHGDRDQLERLEAIRDFKGGKADVLVASDVASKGLDFPGVQHVINYDMPEEIENYVHRIGRTGRSGKTGIATTFINSRQCSESILLDLKHLLKEAKQRVPQFLTALHDPLEEMEALAALSGIKGCAYCGGLGHRIADCPKLRSESKAQERSKKDYFGSGGFGGEM
ncbi:hypothetical protein OEZ86_000105 [Tetradesmus obliquus]|nr:hypothetical protein OEZ86_000105 [Tetradesmus obliquus]